MISELFLVLLLPALFIYCYKNAYKRLDNFPPGPPSLPVYGAFWIVLAHEFRDLSKAFRKIGQKYNSKIIGLKMGSTPTIVLNDPSLIKEMLNREEFDGRMDIILFRLRSYWKKLGIFFTDGYFWHTQRRFSLRYLRDYGFGRRDKTLEVVIADDIKEMLDMRLNGPKYPAEKSEVTVTNNRDSDIELHSVQEVDKLSSQLSCSHTILMSGNLPNKEIVKGDLVFLPFFFTPPFINGLVHVLSRSPLPRAEYKELWSLARGAITFQKNSDDMGGALSLTPWLKDILPNYSGYNGLVQGNQVLLDFFEKLIKDAIDTHDETYDRHFIDMYLSKMKHELRDKDRSTYSVDQLVLTCTDYLFPTSSTVLYVLTFLVERLLLQPEVQTKIHEEIDRVVGRDRLPNLDDRRNMPYVEACIRESMRHDTTLPMGVPHRAMTNTKLGSYNIPENAMLSPNLTMLHMDEEIWGDPENFRPERFIKNGQLDLSSDKSLPFGAGRRLCPGETYARQTMFQVFSAFMQAFTVSTADGQRLLKPSKRIQGVITTIPDFWVRVTPRI